MAAVISYDEQEYMHCITKILGPKSSLITTRSKHSDRNW